MQKAELKKIFAVAADRTRVTGRNTHHYTRTALLINVTTCILNNCHGYNRFDVQSIVACLA
jgi:hypothetical protein